MNKALSVIAAGATLLGCVGSHEAAVRRDLSQASQQLRGDTDEAKPSAPRSAAAREASLPGYVRRALESNPTLRASFERWRASVHRISQAKRLPEPTISFGYFVRSVETRVGPQLARISLQQAFPWPTRLSAGADAASAQARAMQRRFEAEGLNVAERVSDGYWKLWQLRATRTTHQQHLEVIRALSESVRARLAIGAATLAELQQIDLAAARIEDDIRGMDEAERGAEAELRASIGVGTDFPTPTPQSPPEAAMPKESLEVLATLVRSHPMVDSWGLLAEASEQNALAEEAMQYPSFTLGADWIITGEAVMPGVADSGKDAVVVGAGVRLPLWQGSYGESAAAAEAEGRAQRAEQRAVVERRIAELTTRFSELRDKTRRIQLYGDTLVPQAESAYESVLGAYTVGRGNVAQTLLSQRDLLELRIELQKARAEHARLWSKLEEIVGQQLSQATPPSASSQRSGP